MKDKPNKKKRPSGGRKQFRQKPAEQKFNSEPKPKLDPKMIIKKTTETPSNETPRLNKFVANAGICSRRKADEHIKKGMVTINGEVMKEMGYRVQKDDVVTFNGKVIKKETKQVYILMNKPRNTITTSSDEKGRRTVMDIVSNASDVRFYPVGRLDRNTTGLLLFTNDGDLAKKLTHPSHGVKKIYHVTLNKKLALSDLEAIQQGLTLEDGEVQVDAVAFLKGMTKRDIGIEIHIGRNRIVRRIFEHLGYVVEHLDRVYFGGLTKKDLPRGKYRFLMRQEIIMLKHFN